MSWIKMTKDTALTIIVILLLFLGLDTVLTSSIPISTQLEDDIILLPEESFTRGTIKTADRKIVNWKGARNLVHWRFECQKPGTYKVQISHNKAVKEVPISILCNGREISQIIERKSALTDVGNLSLQNGVYELTMISQELGKKDRIPDIISVTIENINKEK